VRRTHAWTMYGLYGLLAWLAVFMGLMVWQNLFATCIAFHLLVCLGIPLVHAWLEGTLRSHWRQAWDIREKDGKGVLIGVGSGLLFALLIPAGIGSLMQTEGSAAWIREALSQRGLTSEWLWPFAVYLIVANSFLEELIWRGFLLQRLRTLTNRAASLALSSLFYAAYHVVVGVVLFGWKWGFIFTLLVFLAGCWWGWLKLRFPSVYPAWASHLLADVGLIISLFCWVY